MSERKPTHNEFTTDAHVSIPLDENDKLWGISVYMPKEIVEQFRALPNKPVRFVMCSTGSGPVGQPDERFYISLIREDWNQRGQRTKQQAKPVREG